MVLSSKITFVQDDVRVSEGPEPSAGHQNAETNTVNIVREALTTKMNQIEEKSSGQLQ